MSRILLILAITALVSFTTPASALDLNSFRAQHKLPPLSVSAALAGAAYAHANDMAADFSVIPGRV